MGEIEVVLGGGVPGQRHDPLQVGAHDAVLGHRRLEPLQAAQLALDLLGDLLGEAQRLELLAQLLGLGLGLVALPQLVLDRLELLAQEVVALALLQLGLDLGLDLGVERHHLELAGKDLRQAAQALGHVELLEQRLLLVGGQAHGAGDEVAEHHRVVDVGDHDLQLLGQVGHLADDAREGALDVAGQGLELGALAHSVARMLDLGDEVGLGGHPLLHAHARAALDEDAQRPVGQAHHPRDRPQHADRVQLVGAGRLDLRVATGDQHDRPVAAQNVVDELEAARLADVERNDQIGERHRVAQREHAQPRGKTAEPILLIVVGLARRSPDVDDGHWPSPLWIGTSRRGSWRPTSGSSTRSIPSSYRALMRSASTSAPSSISRRKEPRSISIC